MRQQRDFKELPDPTNRPMTAAAVYTAMSRVLARLKEFIVEHLGERAPE